MINLNVNAGSALPSRGSTVKITETKTAEPNSGFADTVKAVGKQISKVDALQQLSDVSIKDLLSGKNEDITSVVSTVAKADMSFKLLVGVRNKLIEAYKQTMNMPL